ncbi:PD-(D/E)XK nuclease family protein [Akkermansiaceae bacterium]|nr:PD-(D/E)XK nuclease family protein [Akkermansiaceae bacterium]
MPKRIFLGYDSPFLPNLVSHLLGDPDTLAHTLVIVPTGQSGRTLRESLAAAAGSILAPTVSTPGAMLHTGDPSLATAWLEKLAWIEALESIAPADWQNFSGLFPVSPASAGGSSDWAVSLASELALLRAGLQENLHNLFSASKFLASTPESARWEDLSRLEVLVEKLLASWGFTSRSTMLRESFALPANFHTIILAGVTEMPPCLAKALMETHCDVTAIIAAPESEAQHFSELGLPLEPWIIRKLPPHASVSIVADPAAQAKCALEAVSATGSPSPNIALGSADEPTGAALARVFTENGWSAFHPASAQPLPALVRWLGAWKNWLSKPSSRHLAALLSLPECNPMANGKRSANLTTLNRLRDKHPTIEPEEILYRLKNLPPSDEAENSRNGELWLTVSGLSARREHFLSSTFAEALSSHLRDLQPVAESSAATLTAIEDFLAAASPIFGIVRRSNTFWLQTLLSELPAPTARPPADRAIDVQGWLELLFEPGEHLVICGMNEGFVPARSSGDPWLSENTRKILGLTSDADRHARDAYLLHAMLMMRGNTGSAHLICGKNGAGGEPYLPSRLLLQVPRKELPETVRHLFREIAPPESDLIWTRDFEWQPPHIEVPDHFGVTTLRDYLSCPFRFYLKHLARMSEPAPDRREMDARDFGNIAHHVVENWGKDEEANKLTDPTKLSDYLDSALETAIFREFGKKPPLAIRIQAAAIRQRLEWFAERQAESAAEGWEIVATERGFTIPSGKLTIKGKIDRIDRHRGTGQIRVIDYKTGDVKKGVEGEHRRKITPAASLPSHIPEAGPPFHQGFDPKGKPAAFLWQNLQLPLYALAESSDGGIPIPCYIHLGKTEDNVKFSTWDTFSESDMISAQACADWIVSEIAQRNFWPPAEKVTYDDYSILSQGRPLAEAIASLGG